MDTFLNIIGWTLFIIFMIKYDEIMVAVRWFVRHKFGVNNYCPEIDGYDPDYASDYYINKEKNRVHLSQWKRRQMGKIYK